jgi:hypothetical protein
MPTTPSRSVDATTQARLAGVSATRLVSAAGCGLTRGSLSVLGS